MRITPPLAAYCLLLTSACALTDQWGVNVQQHTAVQRTYKQGESWTMQVTLRHGLRPLDLTGATAIFYWHTNAAQNVWWERPAEITAPKAGLVTAQWTPAMDTGAASYPYWIGIWASGSTSPLWRVTGTIRMLPSPGFTPNTLPLPARSIDFSEISFTNAPWATTNDLASALHDALETNRVKRLYAESGNGILGFSGATPEIYEEGVFTNYVVVLSADFSPRPWAGTAPHPFPFSEGDWSGNFDGTRRATIMLWDTANGQWLYWTSPPGEAYPKTLTFDDFFSEGGAGTGTATICVTTYTRKQLATILTTLSGYERQSGTDIGSAAITLEPNKNQNISFSFGGIGYCSFATGLIHFDWPTRSGRFALREDITDAINNLDIPDPDLSSRVATTNGTAHNLALTGSATLNGAPISTSPTLVRDGVAYRQVWDTNLLTTAWEPIQK